MIPLYHESWFTFRFAEDRRIPRFHLEGVPAGQRVVVHFADPGTLQPLRFATTANVGDSGWVQLAEPLSVRAGEVFIVAVADDRTAASSRALPAEP
ncbi:MAG: hypothetical protein JNM56_14550 [Planctomycetia bacterium]|nr:hypothetical protein [Planctomycetia bacterium]